MPTTVLIAAGEPGIRQLVKRVLGRQVDVVGEAASGEQAVQLSAWVAPDVVLMDLDVPGLDGIAAAWKIKAEHNKTKVILLTAHDEDAYLGFTGKTGADALVRKKDLRAELLLRIQSLVPQRSKATWDGVERRARPPAWKGPERRRSPWPKGGLGAEGL